MLDGSPGISGTLRAEATEGDSIDSLASPLDYRSLVYACGDPGYLFRELGCRKLDFFRSKANGNVSVTLFVVFALELTYLSPATV